jgi:hypothetical protein
VRATGHGILAIVLLSALLQACSGPKSSSTSGPDGGPVPTDRMTFDLIVEVTDADTAVVRGNINDGRSGGASYRLDGGDFLRACVLAVCRTMADNDSVYEPDYIARFDFQSGVDHVVSFNRQEAQDALNSRVALPPDFTLVTPADGQDVTEGEIVQVTWTPFGPASGVTVTFEAECNFVSGPDTFSTGLIGRDADADGTESVDIDEIVEFAATTSSSTITDCAIDVIVRHELTGTIDPAFRNGSATGVVERRARLDYVPL